MVNGYYPPIRPFYRNILNLERFKCQDCLIPKVINCLICLCLDIRRSPEYPLVVLQDRKTQIHGRVSVSENNCPYQTGRCLECNREFLWSAYPHLLEFFLRLGIKQCCIKFCVYNRFKKLLYSFVIPGSP